jgi:hypothetical protein
VAKKLVKTKSGVEGAIFATVKIFDDIPMHFYCDYSAPLRGFASGGYFASGNTRRVVTSKEADGDDWALKFIYEFERFYVHSY